MWNAPEAVNLFSTYRYFACPLYLTSYVNIVVLLRNKFKVVEALTLDCVSGANAAGLSDIFYSRINYAASIQVNIALLAKFQHPYDSGNNNNNNQLIYARKFLQIKCAVTRENYLINLGGCQTLTYTDTLTRTIYYI